MFETLDTIPWEQLRHAYGKATDVPKNIRNLASTDPDVAEDALDFLYSDVNHQGNIYSSTAYVVPFLCELLDAPETLRKPEILEFLHSICLDSYYYNVRIQYEETSEPATDKKSKWLMHRQAIATRVSAGYRSYLSLLGDENLQLRKYAANLLSYCWPYAQEIVPLLKEYATTDASHIIRATMLYTLGQLLPRSAETAAYFQQYFQQTEEPELRLFAALGAAYVMREETVPEMIEVILHTYTLPQEEKERYRSYFYQEQHPDSAMSWVLQAIGPSIAEEAIPVLLQATSSCTNNDDGNEIVCNLLFFLFGKQKRERSTQISDLTVQQKAGLKIIYDNEKLWRYSGISYKLGGIFNVPPVSECCPPMVSRGELLKFLNGSITL